MSMQLGISEILAKANSITNHHERINYLRNNASKPILICLQYTFDPNIKWLISPTLPHYNATNIPGQETIFLAEARRLYLFVEGGHDALTQVKREVLLVQLLEMIDANDIKLLQSMITKKLPYENLDYGVIKEAFPDLLPDITFQTKVEKKNTTPKAKKEKLVVEDKKPAKVKKEKGAKKSRRHE